MECVALNERVGKYGGRGHFLLTSPSLAGLSLRLKASLCCSDTLIPISVIPAHSVSVRDYVVDVAR